MMSSSGSSSRYKPYTDRRNNQDRDKRHKAPSPMARTRPLTVSSSISRHESPRSSARSSSASECSNAPLLKKIKIEKTEAPENEGKGPKKAKKASDKPSNHNGPPVVLTLSDRSMPLLKMIKTSYEKQLKDVAGLKDEVSEKATAMEAYLKNDYQKIVNEIETQQIAASMLRNEKKRRKKKKMLKLKAARHQKQRMKRKLKRQEIHKIRNSMGESPF